jgi:hypothetical protein
MGTRGLASRASLLSGWGSDQLSRRDYRACSCALAPVQIDVVTTGARSRGGGVSCGDWHVLGGVCTPSQPYCCTAWYCSTVLAVLREVHCHISIGSKVAVHAVGQGWYFFRLGGVGDALSFSPKNIGRQALARLGLFGAKIWPCALGGRGLQVGWVHAGNSPLPAKVAPWVQ